MSSTTVSVIIVSYNAKSHILRCIESLLAATQSLNIHISDNGSSDGTIESVEKKYSNLANFFLYKNNQNLGFAKASNIPLSSITDDYILFLNPDSIIPAKAIGRMHDYMESNQEAGMSGCLILNEDGSEQNGCRRAEPTPVRALATFIPAIFSPAKEINMSSVPLPVTPLETDAISGAFMFVRHKALTEVGAMDEGYFLHCEDLDWCKRFWNAGWKIMFLPDVVITHSKGASSKNTPVRVEWHKHKGMIRYYQKFYRNKYSTLMMWLVYTGIWAHFSILVPSLWLKSIKGLILLR